MLQYRQLDGLMGDLTVTKYKGRTVEEAVQKGLKTIQISREQVRIDVISEPVHGWFGRLKQLAVVDLTIKPQQVTKQATKVTGAAIGTDHAPVMQNAQHTKPVSHDLDQHLAANRDDQIARNTDVQADARRREGDAPHAVSKQSQALSPAELRARQTANQAKLNDNLEAMADYLLSALAAMGIDADAEAETYHHGATVTFLTEQEGLLIGRHGRTINALQLLGNTFMLRQGMQHFDLLLDVGGYRERRATTLRRLADNTARDVIASGTPVLLDPMPAFERKVIHAHLVNNSHVQTTSQGREPRRGVVISPR